MTTTPEPCTTWSRKRQHLSVDLKPYRVDLRVGRVGQTLCGEEAHDEARINRIISIYGAGRPLAIADLPLCKRCTAKATQLTKESI